MKKSLINKIGIFFSSLLIFSCTYVDAQNLDIRLLRDLNINRNKTLDPTFKFISNGAKPITIAVPAIVYAIGFIKKDSSLKQKGILIGETFLVSAFISTASKLAFKRERPFTTYPEIEKETSGDSYSFPSGHTSSAFATATSLSIAFPRWYVIAPSFAWACAVGYSRLHLGVHYPSDVFAGAIVGAGSTYITHKINKWLNKKKYGNKKSK